MKTIDAFEKTIARAESLVDLHRSAFPRGRPPASGEHLDILRAAVVLSVSALDSYIHDKIVENVVRVVVHCGKKQSGFPGYLLEALKNRLPIDKALALIYRKRPDQEIQKIIRQHLAERSFQDPGKIASALRYLGLQDLWDPLRRRLRLTSKKKAKEFVVPYVKRRNQIVHEGDVYKSKKYRHKLRAISRPFAQRSVTDIGKFVRALDVIIDRHLDSKFPK